jgi:formylglycine-generating enzyme required for sulfatase activity
MIQVPGGSFLRDDGKTITVSGFQIGKYEVTQKEWTALMTDKKINDSRFRRGKGNNLPMYLMTWYEAVEYCNKLSDSQGLDPAYTIGSGSTPSVTCDFTKNGYRLPTEAEWEYAARGGQTYTYSGSNSINNVAWHGDNSNGTTHTVGGKAPNGYGLYDMNGNVWEWCWDRYGTYSTTQLNNPTGPTSGSNRVNRGADWYRSPTNSEDIIEYDRVVDKAGIVDFKLSFRQSDPPSTVWDTVGFRVVRRP